MSPRKRKRALNITWHEAWPIWLTFGILFGFGALGVWVLIPATQIPAKVLLQGEDATIGARELQPNVPKLFSYPIETGDKIDFFVERDASDKVIASFGSCRRCYRSGHYRHGGQIFCGRCNQPMERIAIGQAPGIEKDCTQIPIIVERSGDHLMIRASAVADAFARWYRPVIAQDRNSGIANQK